MPRLQADFDDRLIQNVLAQVGTRSTQLTRKPSQTEARSTQLIDDQECSFWQWFKQPSDLPNSGIYERDREIDRYVLRQPDRHRSDQIGTIDTRQNENVTIGRTKAQNPRCSAQKKGNLQRHETIADKSLQAFLSEIAVRKRDEIRHRYNLKKAAQVGTRSTQLTRKPAQVGTRSTQLTDYQARRFWQCRQTYQTQSHKGSRSSIARFWRSEIDTNRLKSSRSTHAKTRMWRSGALKPKIRVSALRKKAGSRDTKR